jgi:prepilin-type N-terminal cleavage/methylation domain-containing protein
MNGRKLQAFTLVEILMVVVIIGIAAAIVVPQMSHRDDLKAAAAARVVMSDLMYAQNLAMTRQKSHYLVFDSTGQSYKMVSGDSMTTAITHPVEKNDYLMKFGAQGSTGLESASLFSATFTGSTTTTYGTVGFDDLGAPMVYTGTADQTLTAGNVIVKSGNIKLKIVIEPYTGQLSVNPTP